MLGVPVHVGVVGKFEEVHQVVGSFFIGVGLVGLWQLQQEVRDAVAKNFPACQRNVCVAEKRQVETFEDFQRYLLVVVIRPGQSFYPHGEFEREDGVLVKHRVLEIARLNELFIGCESQSSADFTGGYVAQAGRLLVYGIGEVEVETAERAL